MYLQGNVYTRSTFYKISTNATTARRTGARLNPGANEVDGADVVVEVVEVEAGDVVGASDVDLASSGLGVVVVVVVVDGLVVVVFVVAVVVVAATVVGEGEGWAGVVGSTRTPCLCNIRCKNGKVSFFLIHE